MASRDMGARLRVAVYGAAVVVVAPPERAQARHPGGIAHYLPQDD